MAKVTIRAAAADDAAGIARVNVGSWQVAYRGLMPDEYLDTLDEAAGARRWRRSIEDGRGHALVAIDGHDEVVGFVAFLASRDDDAATACGEVSAIYTVAEVWGDGVGRALMDDALAGLAKHGFAEVTLWVLDGNERAICFYERCGFAPDGATKVDESRGFALHEVRYRRPLASG